MSRVGELRKVRSDKKNDVKPYIPFELYDCIERLHYITGLPIKDIGELLCERGMVSDFVLEHMAMHFVRDFSPNNITTVYIAQSNSRSRRIKIIGPKDRINLRFKQATYNNVDTLSHAAGLTIASTTALLLVHSFRDLNLLESILQENESMLDNNRLRERRYILKKAKKGAWQYDISR